VEQKIMTLHPDPGKQGVRIDRAKYDLVAQAIQEAIRQHGEITFNGLMQAVEAALQGRMEGSVSWYVTTVKLDLEARGIVARVPGSKPQHLRLVES
jgi:hypothetical protein